MSLHTSERSRSLQEVFDFLQEVIASTGPLIQSLFHSWVLRVPVELQRVGLVELLLTNPTRFMRQGIPWQMFGCMPR